MPLRRLALLLLALCLVPFPAHAIFTHLWSHDYGDSDDQFTDGCVADPFGNVVMCGSFYGSINITTPFTSFGRRDAIVAKFSPTGTPLWSSRIGFSSVDTGWDVAADVVGNTVFVGSVGPDPNVRSAFIARYSPTGVQQWMKTFVDPIDSTCYAEVVDTDQYKDIYVAGQFAGSINLGGSTLVAQTDEDVFVAKFNAGGDHIWSKSFSASGGFGLDAIAVDPSGQPVIFGSFAGSVNFGGGALNAVTAFDVYVAKFTTGGAHLWSKRFGLTGDFSGEAMDVDASGRVALAGNAYGTINFGGGILTPVGGPDVFVAVLNSSGNHVWSKMFGGDASEYANDVAFASNTDLLISVYARGPGEFNFGGPQVEAQPDFFDLFVARLFVANGAHRWTQGFTADGGSLFGYVGATGGDFFLGGTMTGPIDFGGGLLSNTHDEDMFVVRFGDHELTGAAPSLARASLEQNSPNPFNPQTRIDYTLVAPAHAVIEIFDASGAVVARLDEGRKPAGSYAAAWNGRDGKGRAVASGVYFYRLAGMPEVAAKKMVLLK